jgi:hypothetical protein
MVKSDVFTTLIEAFQAKGYKTAGRFGNNVDEGAEIVLSLEGEKAKWWDEKGPECYLRVYEGPHPHLKQWDEESKWFDEVRLEHDYLDEVMECATDEDCEKEINAWDALGPERRKALVAEWNAMRSPELWELIAKGSYRE